MLAVGLVTVLVHDYDEAIAFFVDRVGLALVEDTDLGAGKRWVVVGSGAQDRGVLLARATGEDQRARVGDQTGGRVTGFLHTDDFEGDHARMTAAGVRFVESPRNEAYGTVAVFEDLHGNRWDLVQLQ